MSAWSSYLKILFATLTLTAVVVYGFVVLVDPYDSLWFSPNLTREPVSTNQRYSYPALARSDRFDSAIIGTSTTRLLRPDPLGGLLGGRFANLSMNSATAYEQSELHALFVRHHPQPRVMIYGIDSVWCTVEESYQRFTFRPFPPWLYDESAWNDLLYLFNFKAVEEAGQQFAFLIGLRERRYGADGYTDFLPPQSEYDLARVQESLYGSGGPPPPGTPLPAGPEPTAAERAGWTYATHALMAAMLTAPPAETTKILLFVPYHVTLIDWVPPVQRAQFDECKRRLTALAERTPNTHVLDFMIGSSITRDDARYWDNLHYNTATATEIGEAIARAVSERRSEPDLFEYLGGSGATLTGNSPNLPHSY